MKKCYIVAAGDFATDLFNPTPDDFIIAADAGYQYLSNININPNLIVGDFDSLGRIPSSEENNNVIKLPVEKDDTDTLAAIKEGLLRGYNFFYIYGAQGGRLDHTLANIQLLMYLKNNNAVGVLVGNDESVCVVSNGKIEFKDGAQGTMSLISLCSESRGITLKNFYYPLNNATLTNDFPLGVSNKFTSGVSEIEVKDGSCAVIFTCGVDFLNLNM